MADLFKKLKESHQSRTTEVMSLEDYLELCKTDRMAYASAAERMLSAIGEPIMVDTSKDPRLSRIYMNRPLKIYPAFKDFYGIESTIEKIVGYFVHAAQGLEESKQILHLMGNVGGGKAQPLYSKIKTPTGWTTMGEIQVGDKVDDGMGGVTTVTHLFPQGKKDIYEVTLSNGAKTRCCKEHLWLTRVTHFDYLVDVVLPLENCIEVMETGDSVFIPSLLDSRQKYIKVKSIELVAHEDAQCIMVDSAEHLYVTDDNIVTHNSSIAETLKNLMEVHPIYVLTAEDGTQSPVFESPLGLFVGEEKAIEELYSISPRYIPKTMSPWAAKRLNEYGGDISKFKVIKLYPNKLNQIAIAKTEPLDDNNADISSLIGKVDLRKLQDYSAHDADCYAYNGGLCRGNRGLVEMVEIFKSNIKTLNPLLEATQSRSFAALEPIGNIPFEGVILSHCNATEWMSFRNDRKNEAFLDRVYVVKIPYCLRYEEERQIYQKMLNGSSLYDAPCVPETLDILAKFSVLTRLEEHKNSNLYSKMRVLNGENIKNEDNNAKPLQEYKDSASQEEGMSGSSTRWAFKLLAKVFNFDTSSGEISADPVTLFVVLEQEIIREQLPKELEEKYLNFLEEWLKPKYADLLGKQIQRAYIESYGEFANSKFLRYIELADAWLLDQDFKDPHTGNIFDRSQINRELEAIEKGGSSLHVGNPREFRSEVVGWVLRQRAKGQKVEWDSYQKLADVIEANIFKKLEDLLPIISFGNKSSKSEEKAHNQFVDRMCKIGYTTVQTKKIVDWYIRHINS